MIVAPAPTPTQHSTSPTTASVTQASSIRRRARPRSLHAGPKRCQLAPCTGPLHHLLQSLERSSPNIGVSLTPSRRPTPSKRNCSPPCCLPQCRLPTHPGVHQPVCRRAGICVTLTEPGPWQELTKHSVVAWVSSITSGRPKDDASELKGACRASGLGTRSAQVREAAQGRTASTQRWGAQTGTQAAAPARTGQDWAR